MLELNSYSEIYTLGHKYLSELLDGDVVVSEKVDGSQVSAGVINGELYMRSKGQAILKECPQKMFAPVVETFMSIQHLMKEGWIYRGEAVTKPKHNVLAYSRIPKGGVIIYDIDAGGCNYLLPEQLHAECERLGLEHVPVFYTGKIDSLDFVKQYLGRDAYLGGCKTEGVVIKNYNRFGIDKKVLMGKLVDPAFKEKHAHEWKNQNPSGKDFLTTLCDTYRAEGRWQKAIQHLRDSGLLLGEMKDMPALIKEIRADILKEEEIEIKDKLFKWAWPHIERRAVWGLAEWYKELLAKQQFEGTADGSGTVA